MNTISAGSAVVHTTQYQTVTESTYTLPPKTPIVPIEHEPEPIHISPHDVYSMPISSNGTAGQHVNTTV